MAQPSLSEGVRRLETELGVRLFDRIGRSVVVTDAGRAFEGPARRMIRERAVVLDAVGAVRALDTGTLDLVALPTLAVDPLAALVGRFRTLHPGVVVRLVEPDESARGRRSRRRRVTARSASPSSPRAATTSSSITLARQEIVAVCPPGTQAPRAGPLAGLRARGHAARRDAARQVDA